MHWLTFGENLMKIGLILSAQWRFSTKRQKGCPVTLILTLLELLETAPIGLRPQCLPRWTKISGERLPQANVHHESYFIAVLYLTFHIATVRQ